MDPSMSEPPDFSILPEVVWVNVMQYLPLVDRAHLAQTCKDLNAVFNHPSLWYAVEIKLLGSLDKYRHSKVIFPDRYRHMVERFGNYIQDLTLDIKFFFTKLPQQCLDVLDAMSSNCRLRTLTLSCGAVLTKHELTRNIGRNTELDALTNIVARAFRMNTFILKSWPMYDHIKHVNILDVLCANDKIDDLETLSLFWQSARESTWATLNAKLPSPNSMLNTVHHFRNLKSLCLRSTMINDDVLKELSSPKRAQLKRLGILLTYIRSEPNGSVPFIKSETWEKLRTHNPDLGVDVTVVTRMPYIDLHGFLQPEVPLVSISFMTYSQVTKEDLSSLADKYHASLRKYADYSEGSNSDNHLVGLVTRCPQLNEFLHQGKIHCDTVVHLTRLRRMGWLGFQVNYDNVTTERQDVDWDDNLVFRPDEDGALKTRQDVCELDGNHHELMLKNMKDEVSKCIGRQWEPINRKKLEEDHDESAIGIVPRAAAQAAIDTLDDRI